MRTRPTAPSPATTAPSLSKGILPRPARKREFGTRLPSTQARPDFPDSRKFWSDTFHPPTRPPTSQYIPFPTSRTHHGVSLLHPLRSFPIASDWLNRGCLVLSTAPGYTGPSTPKGLPTPAKASVPLGSGLTAHPILPPEASKRNITRDG